VQVGWKEACIQQVAGKCCIIDLLRAAVRYHAASQRAPAIIHPQAPLNTSSFVLYRPRH